MPNFTQEFDGYRRAMDDYRVYQEAKGYRYEGDYVRYWEPVHKVQLEEEDDFAGYGPGACRRGELEDYACDQEPQEF